MDKLEITDQTVFTIAPKGLIWLGLGNLHNKEELSEKIHKELAEYLEKNHKAIIVEDGRLRFINYEEQK